LGALAGGARQLRQKLFHRGSSPQAQVYLPGGGWIEFDPTNALAGGRNLIRVAVTRDPTQAIPMGGSFTGASNPFRGMNVEVEIKAEESAG